MAVSCAECEKRRRDGSAIEWVKRDGRWLAFDVKQGAVTTDLHACYRDHGKAKT